HRLPKSARYVSVRDAEVKLKGPKYRGFRALAPLAEHARSECAAAIAPHANAVRRKAKCHGPLRQERPMAFSRSAKRRTRGYSAAGRAAVSASLALAAASFSRSSRMSASRLPATSRS